MKVKVGNKVRTSGQYVPINTDGQPISAIEYTLVKGEPAPPGLEGTVAFELVDASVRLADDDEFFDRLRGARDVRRALLRQKRIEEASIRDLEQGRETLHDLKRQLKEKDEEIAELIREFVSDETGD